MSQVFLGFAGPNLLTLPNQAAPAAPVNPVRLAVRYKERYPRSFRGENRDNGSQLEREYIVPWQQEFEAAKDLLGYPILAKNNNGRYLSRYLPDSIWWWTTDEGGFEPARPFLWCTAVRHEGADVPKDNVCIDLQTGEPRFENIFLTAIYETLTYKVRSDEDLVAGGFKDSQGNPDESSLSRYVTLKPNPSVKYQTLPQGSFVMVSGTTYPGTPGRLELEADFSVTWHRIPTAAVGLRLINPYLANTVSGQPYVPSIEDCLGTVNLTPFGRQRKGTMLLTAAVLTPITSAIGMQLWDIEYRWKWFPAKSATQLTQGGITDYQHGHNLLLYVAAGTPGYYEVVTKPAQAGGSNYLKATPDDNVNLFSYRDHANLFRVPQLAVDNP